MSLKIANILDKILFWLSKIFKYSREKMNSENNECQDEIKGMEQCSNSCQDALCKCQKYVLIPSSECEKYNTIVVNCNLKTEPKATGALSKDLSHIRIGGSKSGSEYDIFNLRSLYQISSHSIENKDCSRPIPNDPKIKDVSSHSLKVEVHNKPLLQIPGIETQCSSFQLNLTKNTSPFGKHDDRYTKKSKNICTHNIQLELFTMPSIHQAKIEDISSKSEKLIESQKSDIIVISSGDDEEEDVHCDTKLSDMEVETDTEFKSDLQPLFKKTCRTKSCQKAKDTEDCQEIPIETQHFGGMQNKLMQIPSSSSSVHYSTLRSSPISSKMRQLELHRLRVQVERKRLELLDMKLRRELLLQREIRRKGLDFKELEDEKDV
ncbi:uncharacterized protein LOC142221174 [Haematobia irritans]|uniref:uncharacterized protein LOC142221174 n=1 Tax=Haematobia irritans TaxID=7368 RepID=UPI003F502F70